MIIKVIEAGNFKLDGGAMFGIVPKTIWNKLVPADDLNLCTWKMRCLLVQINERLILIDTGIGNKQEQKWLDYYFIHGNHDLIKNIIDAGYHPDEITDVVLTHLHFDHVGGAVRLSKDKSKFVPTFANANYWTHSEHWLSAINPNNREKSTFLKENIMPLFDHKCLNFIDKADFGLNEHFSFLLHNGHTEKMILPIIKFKNQQYIFTADTIPSAAHIKIPYVMGYDVRPLQTMIEKEATLKYAHQNNAILIFDHDMKHEAASIEYNDKGYFVKNTGLLTDFIS